jgi:hypothetical protein
MHQRLWEGCVGLGDVRSMVFVLGLHLFESSCVQYPGLYHLPSRRLVGRIRLGGWGMGLHGTVRRAYHRALYKMLKTKKIIVTLHAFA